LALRQVAVQALNIGGGIFLARLLTPSEFGLYAIVTFLVAFLTAFGGTGLAASLIRQPDEPSEIEYRSLYTLQQVLVMVAYFVG
jgi:O-antigen/teichoic acid export membrane protein